MLGPGDFHRLIGGVTADVPHHEGLGTIRCVVREPQGGPRSDVQCQVAASLLGEHRLRTGQLERDHHHIQEPPGLVDAEEEQVNLQVGFQEQADLTLDLKDAAGILLGIRNDLAHPHLAVVVSVVVPVEVDRGADPGIETHLNHQQADRGPGEHLAGQLESRHPVAIRIVREDVEPVEQVHRILVRILNELLDAVGVVTETDIDLSTDLATKLSIQRRIDGYLLHVGELKLEGRHAPFNQANRLAHKQIEQLRGMVEYRDAEVAEGPNLPGEPGGRTLEGRTDPGP